MSAARVDYDWLYAGVVGGMLLWLVVAAVFGGVLLWLVVAAVVGGMLWLVVCM